MKENKEETKLQSEQKTIHLKIKNMKILRWNLGIAIIRIGYIVRDRWHWWRIGVLILLIGYKLRGEVPQKTWKGNRV